MGGGGGGGGASPTWGRGRSTIWRAAGHTQTHTDARTCARAVGGKWRKWRLAKRSCLEWNLQPSCKEASVVAVDKWKDWRKVGQRDGRRGRKSPCGASVHSATLSPLMNYDSCWLAEIHRHTHAHTLLGRFLTLSLVHTPPECCASQRIIKYAAAPLLFRVLFRPVCGRVMSRHWESSLYCPPLRTIFSSPLSICLSQSHTDLLSILDPFLHRQKNRLGFGWVDVTSMTPDLLLLHSSSSFCAFPFLSAQQNIKHSSNRYSIDTEILDLKRNIAGIENWLGLTHVSVPCTCTGEPIKWHDVPIYYRHSKKYVEVQQHVFTHEH